MDRGATLDELEYACSDDAAAASATASADGICAAIRDDALRT